MAYKDQHEALAGVLLRRTPFRFPSLPLPPPPQHPESPWHFAQGVGGGFGRGRALERRSRGLKPDVLKKRENTLYVNPSYSHLQTL